MSGTMPPVVRMAHEVIDQIRDSLDADTLQLLRKRLPARAVQMEKNGDAVTPAVLLAMARGPRQEFNTKARIGAPRGLTFADLPGLFKANDYARPAPAPDGMPPLALLIEIFKKQDVAGLENLRHDRPMHDYIMSPPVFRQLVDALPDRIDRGFLDVLCRRHGDAVIYGTPNEKKQPPETFILMERLLEDQNRAMFDTMIFTERACDPVCVVEALVALARNDDLRDFLERHRDRLGNMPYIRCRSTALIYKNIEAFDLLTDHATAERQVGMAFIFVCLQEDNVALYRHVVAKLRREFDMTEILKRATQYNASKILEHLIDSGHRPQRIGELLAHACYNEAPDCLGVLLAHAPSYAPNVVNYLDALHVNNVRPAFVKKARAVLYKSGFDNSHDIGEPDDNDHLRGQLIGWLTDAVRRNDPVAGRFVLSALAENVTVTHVRHDMNPSQILQIMANRLTPDTLLRNRYDYGHPGNFRAGYGMPEYSPRRHPVALPDPHDGVLPASCGALVFGFGEAHKLRLLGHHHAALKKETAVAADLEQIRVLAESEKGGWIRASYETICQNIGRNYCEMHSSADDLRRFRKNFPAIRLADEMLLDVITRNNKWYEAISLIDEGLIAPPPAPSPEPAQDRQADALNPYNRDNRQNYVCGQRQNIHQQLGLYRRWRRYMPEQEPDMYLAIYPPEYIRPALLRATQAMLDQNDLKNNTVRAYFLTALFRSEERIMQFFERWANKNMPLRDSIADLTGKLSLPQGGPVDVKAWGDALLRDGPELAPYLRFADKMVPGASLNQTREIAAAHAYQGGVEEPALAAICLRFNKPQSTFDNAKALVREYRARPPVKTLPDITVKGEAFDMPGATLTMLPHGDPRGLFLGDYVNCCQHIDGNAGWCAKQGFLHKDNGFYIVTDAKDQIIAQSWAWRGKDGELVLDSFEALGQRFEPQQIEKLLKAMGKELMKSYPQVTALMCGTGGDTPNLGLYRVVDPAKPPEGQHAYDAGQQYLVWTRTDRAVKPDAQQGVNTVIQRGQNGMAPPDDALPHHPGRGPLPQL